jgi:hypothetical protein
MNDGSNTNSKVYEIREVQKEFMPGGPGHEDKSNINPKDSTIIDESELFSTLLSGN